MPNEDFYWLLQFWAGTWLVCVPLAGSQRCSARVHNILFNLLTIKQQRVSLLGFPFFSQTLVTLDKSLFSFGLSNRRISAVFSCFDQSLILPVRPYKEARLYYLLVPVHQHLGFEKSLILELHLFNFYNIYFWSESQGLLWYNRAHKQNWEGAPTLDAYFLLHFWPTHVAIDDPPPCPRSVRERVASNLTCYINQSEMCARRLSLQRR